ncbi:MAG: glycosyltransferase family 4 protein [Opitutaceae bacterium]|nr:glycosyltransferase family 4 protein [Cytophagales bacterium]
MGFKKTIVVGYLYNSNGMAAWNLEVAMALHSFGHNVVLVHSKEVNLEREYPFRTVCFDIKRNFNFLERVIFHFKRLYNKRYGFAFELDKFLRSMSIEPGIYLFNQSNLYDIRVSVPQYIKASTYPSKLKSYLRSYYLSADFKKSAPKKLINHFIEVVGWYFTDWYAYKKASGILCHTELLAQELKSTGVRAHFVPPPILVHHEILNTKLNETPVFLTVALDVEDKRKRIKWIINNFLESGIDGELRIVGNVSSEFKDLYKFSSNITFLGKVSREEMPAIYVKADIFLFASTSDTWGYVLTEAMSNGLIVIAPDLYPYDYIIGNKKYLYSLLDGQDFQQKIKSVANTEISVIDKEFFNKRAIKEFSHEGFAKKISLVANIL